MPHRQQRANGVASRDAILDAAAKIAGERGYDGTSIKLVSELSGLPPSSIYWHFANKDDLLAAVIDRSFKAWSTALDQAEPAPADATNEERMVHGLRQECVRVMTHPDFLRLGLMLLLERRPVEAAARRRFHDSRMEIHNRVTVGYARMFPALTPPQVRQLVRLTFASVDGLFIAAISEPELDLTAEFEVLGLAIVSAARSLTARNLDAVSS